jgi:hypothetical protein
LEPAIWPAGLSQNCHRRRLERKIWFEFKEHAGMKYYRNQPDYSLFNQMKYGIKASIYDSPRMLHGLRKFQKLVRGFRDGL